ncbi:MAG: S8 family serine peptidase [Vulcanimicrobiota bacterium]
MVSKPKQDGVDIDVVNMSLGGGPDGPPDTLDPINRMVEKLSRQGITVVAAAGNSGKDGPTIGSPAIRQVP